MQKRGRWDQHDDRLPRPKAEGPWDSDRPHDRNDYHDRGATKDWDSRKNPINYDRDRNQHQDYDRNYPMPQDEHRNRDFRDDRQQPMPPRNNNHWHDKRGDKPKF